MTKNKIDTVWADGESCEVEHGGTNIFADLGFADAEEMMLKSTLAAQIMDVLEARKLTKSRAAKLAGLKTADLSNILNAKLDLVSLGQLFTVLNRLGHQIEVRVEQKETENARTLVLAA